MSRQVIHTTNAPAAVAAYSQAIKANGFIFVSGQLGLVPKTGEFISNNVEEQADQVLKNLQAILEAAGSSLEKIVKCTVLLSDIANFNAVNSVYVKYFPNDPPARAAYAVAHLPKSALVEIEAIALE
ncbi:ribonuclease [Planoprotostelium fungivorum]|uniref:Ribonuclease n=1 Tax=Planoprotostelium fungivorum TaxID=1890364 RepID=A0A2P6MRH4_9EUKA|nr:ribonuclease [Planoprotostelium fungivorum]